MKTLLARQNFTGRHVWDNPGLSGYLICLVHLVSLMQPNKPDRPNRPNEQDRLADCFSILPENTKANRHPRWLVEATPIGLYCNQPFLRIAGRPTAPVYQKWASHLFRGISEQETSPYYEIRPNQ